MFDYRPIANLVVLALSLLLGTCIEGCSGVPVARASAEGRGATVTVSATQAQATGALAPAGVIVGGQDPYPESQPEP